MNKTFKEAVNRPTTKQGGLKDKLALTKLAQSESLDIQFADGILSANGTPLDIFAVTGAAFLPAFDDKFSQTLDETITLYSEGFVIPTQRNVHLAGIEEQKKPVLSNPKSVLTAEEYKEGNIRLFKLDNISLYYDSLQLVGNPETTKQDLVNYLFDNIINTLFDDAKIKQYNYLLEVEAENAKQYQALTDAGFININRIDDDVYVASLEAGNVSSVQNLAVLGYDLLDSVFDTVALNLTVKFRKV